MNLNSILLKIRPAEFAEILKRLLRITRQEHNVGQQSFWVDPVSNFGSRLIHDGFYEKDTTSLISDILSPGDIFVDLGANEGYFSVLASMIVGESGYVYAIEPQLRLWSVIIQNFTLNRRTNYTLIPYATGKSEGFIELQLFPSLNTGATTAVRTSRGKYGQKQKALMLPLASIFRSYKIPPVKLLKIDIEGFELDALQGFGTELRNFQISNILVEMHPSLLEKLGQTAKEVEDFLRLNGYENVSGDSCELVHWKKIG